MSNYFALINICLKGELDGSMVAAMAQSEISEEGGDGSSLYILSPAAVIMPGTHQVLLLLSHLCT